MAADIDVRSIAAFSSLPEASITNVLSEPTKEAVRSLLEAIQVKVKEYDVLKSEKLKIEVEHETFVRTSESKVKVLQNTRDKALADVSKIRVDLQNAENARLRAEADLEQNKQSSSSVATETSNLRSRISSLESSNRDTLSLLEAKNAAYDRLSQELSEQHSKVVELRKEVSSLEQANQKATSALTTAKFTEQRLEQDLALQKKNNDWLENERRIKTEEHTSFRKEKNAKISELTRSNEQYIEDAETLKRSENSLKLRVDEQINRNEDLLQQIQQLREKEISDADNYRVELESINRLAQLQEASANTAKQRVEELQMMLEEVREEAAAEVGEIRAEVEAEHHEREAAEQRVAELESRMVELESEVEQNRQYVAATPRRDTNGMVPSTPQRPSTPSGIFTPSFSARFKGPSGNITVSQLYGEYKNLERELNNEKRLNVELQSNIDSMLEDLETKRPEMEELKDDQTRLQSEVFEMSTLVEKANHERDDAVKQARILTGKLDATSKELANYQQSVRDRNSQLRWMLMDREARAQGGSLSELEFEELQRAAAEADVRDSEHLSETQRVVNQQLVLFKSVGELQQQNENQLVTIRNLVGRLESAEAKDVQQLNHQLKEELEASKNRIIDYQAEIKHMIAQSKSFVKERDMFKSMLTRRGQLAGPVDPNDFSKSMPLPADGPPVNVFDGRASTGSSDYAKLLQDLQKHFDNYRQETSTDATALRSQLNELSKRNSQLQAEASRVAGQLTLANQRTEILQANFNVLKTENAEIQKRSYVAMETATKQEMKTAQAAEELVEAKGHVESLRRESANLKAEKDLWRSVEKRLVEDNESLRNERGRLDQLNGSLQNLLNEREQADAETRRRLQTQIETLENELTTAKRKLNEELEDSKRIALRREYEHDQNQKRVDGLVTGLSQTREELAAAKTSRDHLQARVDELSVELRSAEERLEVLTKPNTEPSEQTNGAPEETLSREQELSVEVSELKRDLGLKSSELDRATEQIEVYKNIAQSAEERLQELTETNDQFRAETETAVAEKDHNIKNLEQRIEDVSSELNTTNSELTTLRDEQAESNRKLGEQKNVFEAEIARLKEAEAKNFEQAQFNLEATRAQAEIATEAQQSYENELLKHAEAAKNLNILRSESNQIRLEAVDLRSQVDTARSDLEQKESSWSEMKDRYEREVADIKKRREELSQQNKILHGQLENLTRQIAALQRDRAALGTSAAEESSGTAATELSDMQEVIKYLRQDKEIVDVQYHILTQDAKRLRQQLEFAQSQLDETRLKLGQQQRQDADSERNAISHKKLMDTLNELNLFRESSVTLRAEAKQASQALAEKTKKIEELDNQIQPLQARIAELDNLSELREGEMKLLQEDRDHWQQRCQNILSKYDRVDPAELESLKSKIGELETERDQAVAGREELQVQIDAHPAQIDAVKSDLRNRLAEQFKGRSQQLKAQIKDKQTELDTANAEKASLQAELESVQQQLESAQTQAQAQQSETTPSVQAAAATTAPVESAAETTFSESQVRELRDRVAELEIQITEKNTQIETLAATQEEKFRSREAQMKEMLNKRLAEVKQQLNAAKDAALQELRDTMTAEHQREVQALTTQPTPTTPKAQEVTDDSTVAAEDKTSSTPTSFESFLDSITEAQARQLVQKSPHIHKIVASNIRKRVESEKEALRKEFAAQAATGDADKQMSDDEFGKRFQVEAEAIIKAKEEEFTKEKEAMSAEFEEKLENERQRLIAEKDAELASERLHFSAESEKKIAEQVANAQALAEKRATVKLNMAQNQARVANAKIEVVSKAAEETPDKAVKDVWEIAKVTKPPPQQTKAAVPPSPTVNKTAANSTVASAPQASAVPASSEPPVAATPNGAPETVSVDNSANIQNGADESAKTTQSATTTAGATQPKSQLPQTRGGFRGGRGGGIPVPAQQGQAPATRGSGIPRGGARGRGTGRGGAQSGISSAAAAAGRGGGAAGAAGSPTRGGLNPGAQQFTPGNKRAREDNEGGSDGNIGKRIRGGGQGGA